MTWNELQELVEQALAMDPDTYFALRSGPTPEFDTKHLVYQGVEYTPEQFAATFTQRSEPCV